MKKFLVLPLIIIGFCVDTFAATRPAARATRGSAGTASTASTAGASTTARAARVARTAPVANTATAAPKTVNRGRAATTTAAPKVQARAATTQKVIGTGTKVASAAKNVVVNQECLAKYEGCMDAFCMLDNESGGRCLCSDKNAEFDTILAEIEKLDQQSYQMATFGVEKIEMGANADDIIASANAAAQSVLNKDKNDEDKKKARRTLDLTMWDTPIELEDEDIFGSTFASSPIDGKEGDALHAAAADLCVAQIPECAADMTMLQMMYAQRVKSDCAAYENSLKQQKNASQQKLYAAESALREAALEQFQNANKYDLGQCTTQFKKCMQTTAGCGDDFAQCATISAMDTTNTRKSSDNAGKVYSIKGAVTTIDITAATYDTLMAKKPICEHITQSCVKVADNVWDTFLKEVAPQVKAAELIAEDNVRQGCVANISNCFQKACKDNIDPNDPDGSYDLCLTRPESMLNLCKVPLNACGIDEKSAKKSDIWDFVVARLAAMRVDACTNEVKSCLTDKDRCGEDYANCIGLDTDTIMRMCPYEKLVACQLKYGEDEVNNNEDVYGQIASMVTGIFLNIDNNMLTQCQARVNEVMLEVCGDVISCPYFENDAEIGTDSLIRYTNEDGNYVIDGMVSFGNVKISKNNSTDEDVKFGAYGLDIAEYKSHIGDVLGTGATRSLSALQNVATKIEQRISVLSQDPQIQMCVEGRDISQVRGGEENTYARFPHLLDSSMLAIIESGIEQANKNYMKKFNTLVAEAMEAQSDSIKAATCSAMATNPNAEPECETWDAENGEPVCVSFVNTNPYADLFNLNATQGLSTDGEYNSQYVISSANINKTLELAAMGHGEFVQTDSFGNMLGYITYAATYASGDNTCTITTTTQTCADADDIITTDTISAKKFKNTDLNFAWEDITLDTTASQKKGRKNRTSRIKNFKVSRQEYHGTVCKEFAEPIVTKTTLKM